MFNNKLKQVSKKEDTIWESISDLMSGLMIIFLFISVSYMSKISKDNIKINNEKVAIQKEQEAIQKVVNTYESIRGNIYDDLYEEFKDDMDKWSINIDREDLTVSFLEPDVFFKPGESQLNQTYKAILQDFFPRYINIVYGKYKGNIEEVKIEGYTSSEWDAYTGSIDAYFLNMKLSQDRTRKVLEYVMKLEEVKVYEEWLIEHITANGMSSSHRYFKEDGIEDKEKSRRVEFRIKTNAEQIINEIIDEYMKE